MELEVRWGKLVLESRFGSSCAEVLVEEKRMNELRISERRKRIIVYLGGDLYSRILSVDDRSDQLIFEQRPEWKM